jgi:C4-dicarboxylate transporter DctM subunit
VAGAGGPALVFCHDVLAFPAQIAIGAGVIALLLAVAVLALLDAPLFVLVAAAAGACWLQWTTHPTGLLPLVQAAEPLLQRQEFLAIPLFAVAGAVMTSGGMAARLVAVAREAFAWLPGGLPIAAVMACVFFAAVSGSSPVTLLAVAPLLVPALRKAGHGEDFSLGLVTTAGSLGCLVPPSQALLIYAASVTTTSARVDPQELFLAGLAPAIGIAFLLCAHAWWVGRRVTLARPGFSLPALRQAIREGFWALLLPVLVLGGIWCGFYTPSEAGAVAAVYALAVTGLVHRELTRAGLVQALIEAGTLMGTLLVVLILAFSLGDFLADAQVQDRLVDLLRQWRVGPLAFLLLVNAALLGIGALTDSLSCTLLFAPLLAPVAVDLYGLDPLHFAVVFVANMEVGYLLPPVATNLFVASALFGLPLGRVARAVAPTLAILCLALLGLTLLPAWSTGLVRHQRGQPVIQASPWHAPGSQPPPAPTGMAALTLQAFADVTPTTKP